MGFKTTNYESKALGISVPEAYARLTRASVNIHGVASATFEIQQTREEVGTKKALALVPFSCDIDKELPLHKQIYEKAKEKRFKDWEDDIVNTTEENSEVE